MMVKIAGAFGVSFAYLLGSEPVDLDPDEERLFRKWRGLSPQLRREVEAFLDYLRATAKQRTREPE